MSKKPKLQGAPRLWEGNAFPIFFFIALGAGFGAIMLLKEILVAMGLR